MLDQAQIQALFEYAHVGGNVDLFAGTFHKLYMLIAEDRDWAPGEVRAANGYLPSVIKVPCPHTDKPLDLNNLDGCRDCPWYICDVRKVLFD